MPEPKTDRLKPEDCEHDWELAPGDWDLDGERSYVVCSRCDVSGERDDETGNVAWPAT